MYKISLTTTNLADAYRVRLDISMAKSRKVRGGNYVQLATVTNDGFPKCRTVVQRGLLRHGDHSVDQQVVREFRITDVFTNVFF